MCHGKDLNGPALSSVNNQKRKSAKQVRPSSQDILRPTIGRIRNLLDRMTYFGNKRIGDGTASGSVPFCRSPSLFNSLRMKLYNLSRRHSPAIMRRASDQGMGFTLELSNSLSRVAISLSHSASRSESTVSSMLSSSEPARAARTSGGSFKSSLSMLEVSKFMALVLTLTALATPVLNVFGICRTNFVLFRRCPRLFGRRNSLHSSVAWRAR